MDDRTSGKSQGSKGTLRAVGGRVVVVAGLSPTAISSSSHRRPPCRLGPPAAAATHLQKRSHQRKLPSSPLPSPPFQNGHPIPMEEDAFLINWTASVAVGVHRGGSRRESGIDRRRSTCRFSHNFCTRTHPSFISHLPLPYSVYRKMLLSSSILYAHDWSCHKQRNGMEEGNGERGREHGFPIYIKPPSSIWCRGGAPFPFLAVPSPPQDSSLPSLHLKTNVGWPAQKEGRKKKGGGWKGEKTCC